VTPLGQALVQRIKSEGPLSVEAYMEACNAYYYATRDPLGAAGDFTTAPEIHQMFGEIVGATLADVWLRAGSPENAVYAELGPGRGTLADDALRVLRRVGFAGEVHLVETSPALREAQANRVPEAEFHETLLTVPPERPLLMVANEFFDALPVRQFVGDYERRVEWIGGRFAFDRDGEIRESSPAREEIASEIAKQLDLRGGVAIIVDYGHDRSGAIGDTLQAVRGHAYGLPLDHPGEQDLTAHVDFAALAEAARRGALVSRVASQGTWLETLGIGARAMALAAKNPQDTEAIATARRRLCDEEEMGQLFKVMAIRSPNWPEVAGLEG
jgi:NADH dehydrogenase [ubiquinone] 1 alpha subcomplex assembly factor 7